MGVLVLQHIACEPPGAYEDVLRGQGWSLMRVELDEGEPLPDWRLFDALIVMGGPMSANDDAALPWLRAEKGLIAQSVRAGLPVWGVCLGAQLLAASLGARVYTGSRPEVGVCSVELTQAAERDPVFACLPRVLPTLQWHGDSFDLPEGAILLAGSTRYPNQAFRVGELAYGLQFHLEASEQMASEWLALPAYAEALEQALGPGSADRLLRELRRRADTIQGHGRDAFARWLALAAARAS
jgi:GMP synthase-like glutamine amidotransferase